MGSASTDSSGRTTYRDSMGRNQGSATVSGNRTTYRDAQGRLQGTATTDSSGRTTYRDAQGRLMGKQPSEATRKRARGVRYKGIRPARGANGHSGGVRRIAHGRDRQRHPSWDAGEEKAGKLRDIADPWYTGNFDTTYDDILEGCTALLTTILPY